MEQTEESFSKLNIFLFLLLIVLVAILSILNVNNRANDLSVSDVEIPCETDTQCPTGQKCVDMNSSEDIEAFKCTDGGLYEACDKSVSDSCQAGLTCASYYVGGTWTRCTDGKEGNYCEGDSTCQDGMQCVNSGLGYKRCTPNILNSYCDKDSTACSDGTKCIDMDSSSNEIFRCTDSLNGNPCNEGNQCSDGSKCVSYHVGSSWLRCTDGSVDNHCDTTVDCSEGNTCVDRGDGYKRCTDGNPGSPCSTNTDCNSGGQCVSGANNIKTCIAAGSSPTCGPTTFGTCADSSQECLENEEGQFACTTVIDTEPDVVSCQKLDSNESGKVDLSDFDYIVRNWNQLCGGI